MNSARLRPHHPGCSARSALPAAPAGTPADSRFWFPGRVAHVTGSRLTRESQHAPGHGGGRSRVVGAGRLAIAHAPQLRFCGLVITLRHVPPPPPPALRSCCPGRSGSLRLTLSAPASTRPAGAAGSLSARRSVFPRPRVQPSLRRPHRQTALGPALIGRPEGLAQARQPTLSRIATPPRRQGGSSPSPRMTPRAPVPLDARPDSTASGRHVGRGFAPAV